MILYQDLIEKVAAALYATWKENKPQQPDWQEIPEFRRFSFRAMAVRAIEIIAAERTAP